MMKHKGMTLLEVLIASVLLALIITGMTALFIMGKRFALHSGSRLSASALARKFVDPLQNQVRQTDWSSNCLATGNCTALNGTNWVSPIQYQVNITTDQVTGTELRRAVVTVNWTEPP